MSRLNRRPTAAVCAVAVLAISPMVTTEVRAQAPGVDPEAVEILRRTTEYLGSLEQFSVNAWNLREDLLESGHRVDFDVSGDVTVRRPNKLRGVRHDGPVEEILYYDGTSVTLYNEAENAYVTLAAPETIEEMFLFVYEFVEIYPVSDLIWHGAFPWMMKGVTFAKVVGWEVVDGVRCAHLLFSRPDVDFQIWVPESGPPLPRKYVVTDNATAAMLSIVSFLTDWNLDPTVPDDYFTFVPPEGAAEVPFTDPGESNE